MGLVCLDVTKQISDSGLPNDLQGVTLLLQVTEC